MRILTLLALSTAVLVVAATEASADCSGPTVFFDASRALDRGAPVDVRGRWFGDNCYDTGPPPKDEGVLGRPLDDIEITFIQDGQEWVVATAEADDAYEFSVTVTVPRDVAPGPALLVARWAEGVAWNPDGSAVHISNRVPNSVPTTAPSGTESPAPAHSDEGASTGSAGATVTADDSADGDITWALVVLTGAAAAVIAVAVYARRARRRRERSAP